MKQEYTIHRFSKKDFLGAPYDCVIVEDYDEYCSDSPMTLYTMCAVLAHDYIGENVSHYNIRWRRHPEDEKEILAGTYPGIELTRKGEDIYEVAWLIVPVIK